MIRSHLVSFRCLIVDAHGVDSGRSAVPLAGVAVVLVIVVVFDAAAR